VTAPVNLTAAFARDQTLVVTRSGFGSRFRGAEGAYRGLCYCAK
jgi:hypothetical protein